jgi:chromosome partitioning protein
MAKIISFISRKGGTGKTTNAINLAGFLHQIKQKVILIETDPNYTVNSLRQLELFKEKEEAAHFFHVVASDDEEVADEITKLVNISDYDYVIVDSAGKTTDKGIKELCLVSDLILLTTSLSQNDLLVTYQTVKDILPATRINKKLKIAILPNRINRFTSKREINNTLKYIGVDVLKTYVPNKRCFDQVSTLHSERKHEPIATEIIRFLND